VHDWMPIILHPDDYELWLEGDEREWALLQELRKPYSAEEMIGYLVSTLVNSLSNKRDRSWPFRDLPSWLRRERSLKMVRHLMSKNDRPCRTSS
jgi:hypothetical protein